MIPAGKKFADVVVARFTGKKPASAAPAPDGPEPDGDEGPNPAKPSDDDGDEEPGTNGKVMIAAQRRGDGEALEEAVKAIVRECMEENGYGK